MQLNRTAYHSSNNSLTDHDLELTSSFLKKQISKIIKEELKIYGHRTQLEADLEEHNKKLVNQQLLKTLFDQKLNTFRAKETQLRRKKYEEFTKKKKQREEKLKHYVKGKQQNHQQKFSQITHALINVKERHKHIVMKDSNMRLNKLRLITQERERNTHSYSRNSSSRALNTSQSHYHRDSIRLQSQERQGNLITKYLNKIQRAQSRVLEKEISHQNRAKSSKNSRVKCLVEQRAKKENEMMQRTQQQFNSRMNHFEINKQKSFRLKESVQINRSALYLNKYHQAAKKRQLFKNKDISAKQSRASDSKENLLYNYRSSLNLTNNKRSKQLNLKKMQEEQNQIKLESAMRILTQKLQKIKSVKYGQKLDANSIKIILSMLNKDDPEYKLILEFLQSERKGYLQGMMKKEEQRNKFNKSKKGNNANKTATL